MTDFNLPPERRLENWQNFRESLNTQDDFTQLESVATYWSMAPILNWYLDDEHPEEWPTPWEIIYDGNYCSTTIAFLMKETLRLSNGDKWENSRFSIKFIKDLKHDKMVTALIVDDEWVLNYDWSKVINWSSIASHVTIINSIE